MKKLLQTTLIAIPLTVALSGCVISIDAEDFEGHHSQDWQDREYDNRKKIARLNVGMGLEQVQEKLGASDFSEVHKEGASSYTVLFYRTHRKHGDGVTTKDECTPVIFRDGVLDGWGAKAYQQL